MSSKHNISALKMLQLAFPQNRSSCGGGWRAGRQPEGWGRQNHPEVSRQHKEVSLMLKGALPPPKTPKSSYSTAEGT